MAATEDYHSSNSANATKNDEHDNYHEYAAVFEENIPEVLKRIEQWVCWRGEWSGEKLNKPPKQPTGNAASSTDERTWSPFDHALCAARKRKRYGLGLAGLERTPYTGIDIDGCIKDGEVDPKAQEIVDHFDSYTEITPSLTGLRIWVEAEKAPTWSKNKGENIEVYCRGRFFTVTGRHLEGTPRPIERRQAELDAFMRDYAPPKREQRVREPHRGPTGDYVLDLESFLEEFGVTVKGPVRDNTSQSAYRIVCPWVHEHTGGDDSGTRVGQYESGALWFQCDHAHCDGRRWEEFREELDPEAYRRVTFTVGGKKSSSKGEGKPNQIDLVNRYIAREPDVAYGVGSWRRYGRGVWSEIDVVEVEKGVLEVLKEAIPEGITPSSVLLSSVVNLLRVEVHIPSYMWADPETGIIVCQNGTLEIEGRNFREHRREDYALYSVAFDYDPDAKAEVWEEAFKKRLGRSWTFLQEYAGYSLTTRTDLEASAFLVGPLGCGKSTFIEGVETVAGDQAGTLSLADIERSHYALANIPGKTLLTATEAPNAYLKSTATLDTIVSGEMIQIEKKYQNPERIRPVAKILWAMNELPQVRNPSAGIFRRAQVVPFPALKDKGNPLVKRAIKQEGSGILNWALDGLDRLNAQRWFTISEEMREATDGFKAGNDVPAAFIEENCIVDVNRREDNRLLYRKYREWCLDNGYKPLASNRIGGEWERLGLVRKKVNGQLYYQGVELTNAPRWIGDVTG